MVLSGRTFFWNTSATCESTLPNYVKQFSDPAFDQTWRMRPLPFLELYFVVRTFVLYEAIGIRSEPPIKIRFRRVQSDVRFCVIVCFV